MPDCTSSKTSRMPFSAATRRSSSKNFFGGGVAVGDAARDVAGRDLTEPFGERGEALVIEIGARHVDQARGLVLNRADHLRMTVAGGHYRDSGVEIKEAVSIDVFDDGAF